MEVKEKADFLIKLLQNQEFLARFSEVENDMAKTKELFAREGLDFSDDQLEVIIDALKSAKHSVSSGEPLTEAQMDNVAGGLLIKSMAKKAIAGVIVAALAYVGYKVYQGVQERGGVNNQDVLNAANKGKEIAQAAVNQAKDKLDEAANKTADWLATEKK